MRVNYVLKINTDVDTRIYTYVLVSPIRRILSTHVHVLILIVTDLQSRHPHHRFAKEEMEAQRRT